MIPYSPDQQIAMMERGEHAKAVLASQAFLEVVDSLSTYYVSQLVACKPGYAAHEDALRHAHLMQHAVTEIVATLQQWVEVGEQQSAALLRQRAEEGDPQAIQELALSEDD